MSSQTAPTAEEAMHTTLEMSFEDAVPFVQLEHELADFETVTVSRLDQMIEGMLGETVEQTALIVVCHPEIARDALAIDHQLGGMLPCTTVVYERPNADDRVHVHHFSVTKAIRDLGCQPADNDEEIQELVEFTGEQMQTVWDNIEAHGH
ncbi:MAG: hypothetical protein J07HX5_01851 [halophilic archaeon J07HX5]|jgi:Domain of unknown function DUF302.|nr:MAG: hypothetical protein J07HX5_01851 [halophilic archaeon J07HX5]